MPTILVADPRQAFQEQIGQAANDNGFATSGHPDLVLTPDTMTAKVWSRRPVPTIVYDFAEAGLTPL